MSQHTHQPGERSNPISTGMMVVTLVLLSDLVVLAAVVSALFRRGIW